MYSDLDTMFHISDDIHCHDLFSFVFDFLHGMFVTSFELSN